MMVGHHGFGVVAVAHPHHQQLSQLVAGGHCRQHRRRVPAGRSGRGDRPARGRGRCRLGSIEAVAACHHQRHDRGKHSQNAPESHPPMLSWHRCAAPPPRLVGANAPPAATLIFASSARLRLSTPALPKELPDEPVCCAGRRQRRGRSVAGRSRDLRDHPDGAAGHQASASRGRPAVFGAQPGRVRQPQLTARRRCGPADGPLRSRAIGLATAVADAKAAPMQVTPLSRRWLWLVAAVALALSFAASPGQISPDTKLDLTANPLRFLARATNLWNSELPFGQAQNQAYGYLFPHGTFFLASHLLGLPGWVTQRLWWALLLAVGFWGLLRVAEALGIGSPTSRMIAATAFALSPRVLTTLGSISSDTLPLMLAPWVLLPTILALRGEANRSVRQLAGQAGVAVALMGAVNAIATLAGCLPAVIWWACHRPNRRWWRYTGWWLLALALAMSWWLVALILMARISPPFLDFIESSRVTTQWSSLVEVLRGTDSGTPFVAPDATAGAPLVTGSVAILATCLVAAAGLAGLVMRDLQARGRLVTMLLVGVVLLGVGYSGGA